MVRNPVHRTGLLATLGLFCFLSGCRPGTTHQADEAVQRRMFDIQGHRGATGLLPENTLPSFQRAIELGVTTIELDVVISADHEVVVSHDPLFLASICSHGDGRPVLKDEEASLVLYRMPYAEIRRFDCGSRGNASFPGQVPLPGFKPLLRDVLDLGEQLGETLQRPPVRYNVELKASPQGDGVHHPDPATFAELVLDVVVSRGVGDRTTLQSFDPRILQELHAMDSSVHLALLVGRSEDRGIEVNLQVLGFIPDIYSPDYRLVDAALVEAVHSREMTLVPWTVNEAETMVSLKALGVDGLITDYPDIAVEVLR